MDIGKSFAFVFEDKDWIVQRAAEHGHSLCEQGP